MNRVMIADVRRAVCAHYGVTAAQLYSYDQRPEIARPRMMAMYLARTRPSLLMSCRSLETSSRRGYGRVRCSNSRRTLVPIPRC